MRLQSRRGLTLVEILIAMLVFAVGALALAASSGAVVRQLGANARRSQSHALAQIRDEKVHAGPCVSGSGSDRAPGVIADWTATSGPSYVALQQNITRNDSRGVHADEFRSGAPCQ